MNINSNWLFGTTGRKALLFSIVAKLSYNCCYIAGNFFPTAHALIGYFEVAWRLTVKLFPAKICKRATLQNLWRQRVTVHCYLRTLTVTARLNEFPAIPRETVNFVYLESQCFLRPRWDGDSQEIILTVSLGTSHFKSGNCCFLGRKKLLEILNAGIDPPIMIFVNQKKVRVACHRSW